MSLIEGQRLDDLEGRGVYGVSVYGTAVYGSVGGFVAGQDDTLDLVPATDTTLLLTPATVDAL